MIFASPHVFLKHIFIITYSSRLNAWRRGTLQEFSEVYGTTTTEAHHPSLQKKSKRAKILPFASNLRHVKNVDMVLECKHCGLWRLLYSQQKLTKKEREALNEALANFSFTCGAPLQDLELPVKLANVYIRVRIQ